MVMWMTSHFSGWKDICQSDSHFCKLLSSSTLFYHVINIWLENIIDYCEEILMR